MCRVRSFTNCAEGQHEQEEHATESARSTPFSCSRSKRKAAQYVVGFQEGREAYICICLYVYVCIPYRYTRTGTYTYINICIKLKHMYTYTHLHMYLYIHMYIYICTHIHMSFRTCPWVSGASFRAPALISGTGLCESVCAHTAASQWLRLLTPCLL